LAIFSFFLIHKGRKKKSNIILAAFFLVQFLVLFSSLLTSFFQNNTSFGIQITYGYHPLEFLWGPLMYFYIKSQVKQDFKFKFSNTVHLIPFTLAAILIISNHYISSSHLIHNCFVYYSFIYFLLLFAYNFYAFLLLSKYQHRLKDRYSFEIKQDLVWLKFVLYGYIIACTVSLTALFLDKFIPIPHGDYIIDILYATFLVFFNILFYRAMIQPQVLIQLDEKPKHSGTGINTSDIDKYVQGITKALNTNKCYLNSSLTLQELSNVTGISERNISQVINQHWKQNFFSFINAYRVEEAKILLNSFDQNKTTMVGIAFDSGFNSKSAFYDAFKKHTGITPTEYRKQKA
jgi:AraC-like DNA-binding protein